MRVIYPVKTLQLAMVLLCIYGIVFQRQLCSEIENIDYKLEIQKILSHITDQPCKLTFIQKLDFPMLKINNETESNETLIEELRQKRQTEEANESPIESDLLNILQGQKQNLTDHVYENLRKEEAVEVEQEVREKGNILVTKDDGDDDGRKKVNNLTIEKNETEIDEEQKANSQFVGKNSLQQMNKWQKLNKVEDKGEKSETVKKDNDKKETNEAEEKSFSLEQPAKWAQLYKTKGSERLRTCLTVQWTEIFFNRFPGISLFNLWFANILFFILVAVLLLEIAYVFLTKKDQNRKGAWLLGAVHVTLTAAAGFSLLLYRLYWPRLWPSDLLLQNPIYPCQWTLVELVTWFLLVWYILETVFYRSAGEIIVSSHFGSYNVAKKEAEKTYISAYTERLDGSCEL